MIAKMNTGLGSKVKLALHCPVRQMALRAETTGNQQTAKFEYSAGFSASFQIALSEVKREKAKTGMIPLRNEQNTAKVQDICRIA